MFAAKLLPSEVTLSGIFKVVRAVPENAKEPIDVTRFGMSPILASCELAKNRANGISVIFEGSTTDVKSGHA
jgi:hypothetical protein